MKKISNQKMTNITAGYKCIYHALAFVAFSVVPGLGWMTGNDNALHECLNNNHNQS